jgi:mono/diheme cytochrome c family protein
MSLRNRILALNVSVCALLLVNTTFGVVAAGAGTGKEWKVSPRKAKIKNPIAADAASVAQGKEIYVNECQNCHGETGKGDGPEAKDLDKEVKDFLTPGLWDQTDGAIRWKIRSGRRPMPSFKKMLSKEEIWHVTNYLRVTFGTK